MIKNPTPPLLVAEMSANHTKDLELAKATIKAAKDANADAIKIQTYQPSCLTLDSNLEIFKIKGGLWDGYRLYDLYTEAMLPWEWHDELFSYAKKIGIEIFSSPFSIKALELLENLNCPRYKIASFECIDTDFIYAVASTKKPIILSTGIATKVEIKEALNACLKAGCKDIQGQRRLQSRGDRPLQDNIVQGRLRAQPRRRRHTPDRQAAGPRRQGTFLFRAHHRRIQFGGGQLRTAEKPSRRALHHTHRA